MEEPNPLLFPAEIRLQILEYLDQSDETIWQRAKTLRQIRLVNHAWYHTAEHFLSPYLIVTGTKDMGRDLEQMSTLRQRAESSTASLVKRIGIQVSLYADPNDETSLSNFEDIFTTLTEALPECLPSFENLEELHLLLLGRDSTIFSEELNETCRVIDNALPQISDDIPTEYYRAIGKSLASTRLPHLRTLSLDLRSPCDIYSLMQADVEARKENQPTFFASNADQLRSLTVTFNVQQCANNCAYDCSAASEPSQFGTVGTTWRPMRDIYSEWNYSFSGLEYLEISCTDAAQLQIKTIGFVGTATFPKLRFLYLDHVQIISTHLWIFLENHKYELEDLHFDSMLMANPGTLEFFRDNMIEPRMYLQTARLGTADRLGSHHQNQYLEYIRGEQS